MFNTTNTVADMMRILPLLIIWGTACVILLIDALLKGKAKDVNPFVALVGVIAALSMALQNAYNTESVSAFGGAVMVDGLSTVSGIALLFVALLSVLMAWTYLKNRNLEHGEYYALLLLSVSGAMLMAMANDLIVLFLGLEVLSFGLYVLAAFARGDEKSQEASLKYFLLGAFASAFFLYGIALVYGATQTTAIEAIRASISLTAAHHGAPSAMLLAGIALMVVGLGFKAGVIPFHQWTPDVYHGAPTSVTAYMAGAAKIGAFAAILRVFDALIPVSAYWITVIQVIAVLTMVLGNVMAVLQTNVKRLLAYSSIAHAGYLMVAVAALAHGTEPGHTLALSGAMFYLFAYLFMTLGAFGVLAYLSSQGRDYQELESLRGLARHDPGAAYAMVFFMLSLGGIPPTMGFIGKMQIFQAALNAGEKPLAIIMALASVIAVYYYLKIVWMMTFEEPKESAPAIPIARFGALATVAIAAAATLVFGLFPDLLSGITGMVH